MDKIAAAKDFLIKVTRSCQVAGRTSQERRQNMRSAFLTLLSAGASHREELASFLYDWLRKDREETYELGKLHGFAVGDLWVKWKKGKQPEDKAKAKIVRVLMKNPEASDKEICDALDAAGIELYKSKKRAKTILFWAQIVKVKSCQNFISRMRKRGDRVRRLRRLQANVGATLVDSRSRSADLLDLDTLLQD